MAKQNLAAIGRKGEQWAARALRAAGYCILARRWRMVGGELDIIAEDENGYAFVEVKTRCSIRPLEAPELSVNPRKLAFLYRAAQSWLLQNLGEQNLSWRIDVVTVELDKQQQPRKITIFSYFDV